MKHGIKNLPQGITNLPLHFDRKEGKRVIGNGLVGWWLMDDNAANTAVTDHSPHHNHGTFNNAGGDPNTDTHSVIGKKGRALAFDGIDNYVDCGNDSSLNIADTITIGEWVKPNDAENAGQNYGTILSKGENSYFLDINNYILRGWIKHAGGWTTILSDAIITNDNWQHLVFTYDKSLASDNMKLFINGILNKNKNEIRSISTDAEHLNIGKYSLDYFNGTIDEVRIYNRALSAIEIGETYRREC